jgi:hypothetical protein
LFLHAKENVAMCTETISSIHFMLNNFLLEISMEFPPDNRYFTDGNHLHMGCSTFT